MGDGTKLSRDIAGALSNSHSLLMCPNAWLRPTMTLYAFRIWLTAAVGADKNQENLNIQSTQTQLPLSWPHVACRRRQGTGGTSGGEADQ